MAALNWLQGTASKGIEPVPQPKSTDQTLYSKAESRKRARSSTPDEPSLASISPGGAELCESSHLASDPAVGPYKKVTGEQITGVQNLCRFLQELWPKVSAIKHYLAKELRECNKSHAQRGFQSS